MNVFHLERRTADAISGAVLLGTAEVLDAASSAAEALCFLSLWPSAAPDELRLAGIHL